MLAHCHLCGKEGINRKNLVLCGNARVILTNGRPQCRNFGCIECFDRYKWSFFDAQMDGWTCTHCENICPKCYWSSSGLLVRDAEPSEIQRMDEEQLEQLQKHVQQRLSVHKQWKEGSIAVQIPKLVVEDEHPRLKATASRSSDLSLSRVDSHSSLSSSLSLRSDTPSELLLETFRERTQETIQQLRSDRKDLEQLEDPKHLVVEERQKRVKSEQKFKEMLHWIREKERAAEKSFSISEFKKLLHRSPKSGGNCLDWELSEVSLVTPTPPARRFSHTCTVVNNKVFVIGGQGEDTNPILSVGMFDFTEPERVTYTHLPESDSVPLIGHSSCAFRENLVVFGGGDGKKISNKLLYFNTKTFRWNEAHPSGKSPLPRVGHTATICHDKLLIVGGFVPKIGYTLQIHVLAGLGSGRETWTKPEVNCLSTVPPNRMGHCATFLEPSTVMFFGGSGGSKNVFRDFFKVQLGETALVTAMEDVSGFLPLPSTNHQSVLYEQSILLIGGSNGQTHHNVMYSFVPASGMCMRATIHGTPLPGVSRHSCFVVGPHVYIYGGYMDGKPTNHLLRLTPDSSKSKKQKSKIRQPVVPESQDNAFL